MKHQLAKLNLSNPVPTDQWCAGCGSVIKRDIRSRINGDLLCGPCRYSEQTLTDRLRLDRAAVLAYIQEGE